MGPMGRMGRMIMGQGDYGTAPRTCPLPPAPFLYRVYLVADFSCYSNENCSEGG